MNYPGKCEKNNIDHDRKGNYYFIPCSLTRGPFLFIVSFIVIVGMEMEITNGISSSPTSLPHLTTYKSTKRPLMAQHLAGL